MSEMENNEMVNVEEQNYAPEEEKSSNGTLLLIGIGAGCAALGYAIKSGVDAIKRHHAAKKEGSEEDKPKEKKGFKLFGKKDKSEKKETKETEKADEAKAKEEES